MKRNKGRGCLIFILMVVVIGIVLAIVLSNSSSGLLTGNVTYVVEGTTTTANITYMNDQGGIEQFQQVMLPFQKSFTVKYGMALSLVAQNANDSGSITCKIMIDNTEVKSSTSEGAFVIATCADITMPRP